MMMKMSTVTRTSTGEYSREVVRGMNERARTQRGRRRDSKSSALSRTNDSDHRDDAGGGGMVSKFDFIANVAVQREVSRLPIKETIEECLKVFDGDDDDDEDGGGSSNNQDLILQAPPGAGKTTTIPLAILFSTYSREWFNDCDDDRGGTILVLEPRRVAARAAAQRMAQILNENVGDTVGYNVRFDRKVSKMTRVEVCTEGVLKNRIQKDPSLRGVKCVIFDEFHERNLDSDLSLALTLRAKTNYGRMHDLKIVIMSATLGDVAVRTQELMQKTLRNENAAKIVQSEGKSYPVETIYVGGSSDGVEDNAVKTVELALADKSIAGNVLLFLPGAAEIRRVVKSLQNKLGEKNYEVLPLYGAMPINEQNYALTPAPETPTKRRRIVVSTPIAESSLTVPGVTIVCDSGLRRAPRYDHSKGMTRLTTERVSMSSADQRRGRAGRIAEGKCYRMWNENSMLSTFQKETTPEILTADLTSCMLTIANALDGEISSSLSSSSNTTNESLAFLDPPPAGPRKSALKLLEKLRAIEAVAEDDEENVTYYVSEKGKAMNGLPCHPRIGSMLLFASTRGAASTRLACQLAAGVDSDKSLLRGRDAPLDARSYARAIQGRDIIVSNDSISIGSSGGFDNNNDDDEYRKKLGKKIGERGIDVIRVPVDAKLPDSSKRSKNMKQAPKGKKTSAKSAIIDALSKSYSSSNGTNGSNGNEQSSLSSYLDFEIDEFAVSEARKSSQQLARNIVNLAKDAQTAKILRIADSVATDIDPDINTNEPVFEEIFCGAKQFEASLLLAAAFPDRIAIKSGGRGANTFKLSGGGACSISSENRDDPIAKAEALVVCELRGNIIFGSSSNNFNNNSNQSKNDIVKLASPLTKEILTKALTDENLKFCLNVTTKREIVWAENSNKVVSREVSRIGDCVLDERIIEPSDVETANAIIDRVVKVGVYAFFNASADGSDSKISSWLKRCSFANGCDSSFPDVSDQFLTKTCVNWLPEWLPSSVSSKQEILRRINLRTIIETSFLSRDDKLKLENLCPESIRLPSGTQKKINYDNLNGENSPMIECRLQELFGLEDTPIIAGKKATISLLSPASRPVQVTKDLKSFWQGEYENVRKELKGRYPRHYWPDNPLEAEPTSKAKPRPATK